MGFGIKILKLVSSAGFVAALGAPAFATDCPDGSVELRGDWGLATFSVEIADDGQERATGLMNR
ncbi:MAG: hypothetical protein ACC619_09210, partial [Paracoccaceae bacterium]